MTETHSSIKEAIERGFLDLHLEQAGPRRRNRRNSRRATTEAVSFTGEDGDLQGTTRLHPADTRYSSTSTSSSSFISSIGEDTIMVDRICLSSTPPPEEIDLSEMTSEDLQRLKVKDPFMYYSIPEVHYRRYKFEDEMPSPPVPEEVGGDEEDQEANFEGGQQEIEDACNAAAPSVGEGGGAAAAASRPSSSSTDRPRRFRMSHRQASCPAGMLANAELAFAKRNVVKCRRLSTEADPLVVCSDFPEFHLLGRSIRERDEGEEDEEDDDDDDLFLRALMMNGVEEKEDDNED